MGPRKRRRHLLAGLLSHDPVPWILSADHAAITALVRRDRPGEEVEIPPLWALREPRRLCGRQLPNGAWRLAWAEAQLTAAGALSVAPPQGLLVCTDCAPRRS